MGIYVDVEALREHLAGTRSTLNAVHRLNRKIRRLRYFDPLQTDRHCRQAARDIQSAEDLLEDLHALMVKFCDNTEEQILKTRWTLQAAKDQADETLRHR